MKATQEGGRGKRRKQVTFLKEQANEQLPQYSLIDLQNVAQIIYVCFFIYFLKSFLIALHFHINITFITFVFVHVIHYNMCINRNARIIFAHSQDPLDAYNKKDEDEMAPMLTITIAKGCKVILNQKTCRTQQLADLTPTHHPVSFLMISLQFRPYLSVLVISNSFYYKHLAKLGKFTKNKSLP